MRNKLLAFQFLSLWMGIALANADIEGTSTSNTQRRAHLIFEVKTDYAQTRTAWQTLELVESHEGKPLQMVNALKNLYGLQEEAFARVQAKIQNIPIENSRKFTGYFLSAAESNAFARFDNPVIPEIYASALWGGLIGFGLETSLLDYDLSTGLIFGRAREIRIQAISTDIIDKLPKEKGTVGLWGFDFRLKREISIRQNRLSFEVLEKVSFFNSSLSSDEDQSSFFLRNKIIGKWSREIQLFDFSGHLVSGPQPLPVDIFPRIRDYARQTDPLPELGAQFGWGAEVCVWNNLRLLTGLYAGYWGAALSLELRSFQMSFASWGVETSSAYHTDEERLWMGSIRAEL